MPDTPRTSEPSSQGPRGIRRGPIEQIEREAQLMMAATPGLPIEGSEELEPFGVKLGPLVIGPAFKGSGVLRLVFLPDGWLIRPRDDHDMWSDLVDDKGDVRAEVFFKCNPYEQRGFVRLVMR